MPRRRSRTFERTRNCIFGWQTVADALNDNFCLGFTVGGTFRKPTRIMNHRMPAYGFMPDWTVRANGALQSRSSICCNNDWREKPGYERNNGPGSVHILIFGKTNGQRKNTFVDNWLGLPHFTADYVHCWRRNNGHQRTDRTMPTATVRQPKASPFDLSVHWQNTPNYDFRRPWRTARTSGR